MPVLHEPVNLADLLKYEAPNLYSRDEVVVAAGQTLALGDTARYLADRPHSIRAGDAPARAILIVQNS